MAKRKTRHSKASVADVLGTRATVSRPGIPRRWREAYDRLVRARDQLQRQQSSLSRDASPSETYAGMHMAEAGTDASEQDLALGLISFDSDTVHEIDLAIERIRNGTYGICELTGRKIGAERLKAVPWTRFSAQAEKELEQNGARRRVGAGRREGVGAPPVETEEPAESDNNG